MKFWVGAFCFVALLGTHVAVLADKSSDKPGAKSSVTNDRENIAAASLPKTDRPLWKELSSVQHQSLSPLASVWDELDGQHKLKWLEISRRFEKMKPDEQTRMQERMRAWVALTPEQRRVAREVYSRAKKLNTDQKSAQWLQYQQLPEEQKKKLMEEAGKGNGNGKVRTLSPPGVKHAVVPPLKSVHKQVLQQSVLPQN